MRDRGKSSRISAEKKTEGMSAPFIELEKMCNDGEMDKNMMDTDQGKESKKMLLGVSKGGPVAKWEK